MADLKEQLEAILDKAGYLSQYPGTMARILMENGVEIPVRCKDCAWCHQIEDLNYCENPNTPWIDDEDFDDITVADNDFCSYGERRIND